MYFKYGFKYKNVMYGWNNKKLYKLPYVSGKRSYSLKEIPYYCFKSTIVYNIQRTKLTMNRLKQLTSEININLETIKKLGCPF